MRQHYYRPACVPYHRFYTRCPTYPWTHTMCVFPALCCNSKVLRMMEEVKIGLSLSATSWKHAGLRQHPNACSIKQQNMVTFAPTIPTCNYFLHISRMPAQTSMALAPEMKVVWWKQHQMTRSQGNGELIYKPFYTTPWRDKDNIPSMFWTCCAQYWMSFDVSILNIIVM